MNKTNRIFYKFDSEKDFNTLKFAGSCVITVPEIKTFLQQKKKINFQSEKVVFWNVNKQAEVDQQHVEADNIKKVYLIFKRIPALIPQDLVHIQQNEEEKEEQKRQNDLISQQQKQAIDKIKEDESKIMQFPVINKSLSLKCSNCALNLFKADAENKATYIITCCGATVCFSCSSYIYTALEKYKTLKKEKYLQSCKVCRSTNFQIQANLNLSRVLNEVPMQHSGNQKKKKIENAQQAILAISQNPDQFLHPSALPYFFYGLGINMPDIEALTNIQGIQQQYKKILSRKNESTFSDRVIERLNKSSSLVMIKKLA